MREGERGIIKPPWGVLNNVESARLLLLLLLHLQRERKFDLVRTVCRISDTTALFPWKWECAQSYISADVASG